MGIPWRRGYLLHGPPGNGKSSMVLALAGVLGSNISMINLASFPTDDKFTNALLNVPKGNIVLLEDVDAAYDGREKQDGMKLSFSSLLNAIDGVAAQEGRILVMTTNHKERLDPALIRPGRADMHVYFGDATPDQAREMFRRFFPEASHEELRRVAAALGDRQVSMARLQEHLLKHRNSPADAFAAAADLAPPPASTMPQAA